MPIVKLRTTKFFSRTSFRKFPDKPKADIVEIYRRLVGGEIKISYRAILVKCCFHEEKTPSLALYRDTQSFYCFGCGKSGDIYSFVQGIKHCDFKEALKIIREL